MDALQLKTVIENTTPDVWASRLGIYSIGKRIFNCLENMRQYLPENHAVTNTDKRKDKLTYTESEPDENGNTVKTYTGTVPVARLTLSIQKKIVLTAAAFLGKPSLETSTENEVEERLLSVLQKTWDDNKLDWKFTNIAKKTMSEYECAELWFTQNAEDGYWDGYTMASKLKLSMKVLAPSLGDELFPVFDDYGSMIAFFRKYKTKDVDATDIEHVDLYTAEAFYFAKQVRGKWLHSNKEGVYESEIRIAIPNVMKKIPIIYYCQPTLEWSDVQSLIDRLETKISNHADTNDYFDSPILLAKGVVEGMANKDDRGKFFELKGDGADMKYLTWDQAPESTKMEIDNLIRFIFDLSYTPNMSFDAMKGLGAFSKVALDMFFIDARMKAADKQEIFGEAVQRRVNYLKHSLMIMDQSLKPASRLSIKIKFNSFLPVDEGEQISLLNSAVKGGLMSQDTAIRNNPLLSDAESEIEKIKDEQDAADKKAADLFKQQQAANPPNF